MSTPPVTPPQNPPAPTPGTLARQVRLYRTLALCLAGLLLVGGGAFYYLRRLGQPVTIVVDGKPLATLRNAATASRMIAEAEKAKMGAAFADAEPIRLQKVRLERAPADAAQDPDATVRARLEKTLTLKVHAFVILVSGVPSLGLPTSEAATRTLQVVKDHWVNQPPAAPPQGAPTFVQSVTVERRAISTAQTRQTPEMAASYYWTPPPAKTYIVRPGDLGSRIAARNHLSLTELITANPHVNLNRLHPGDVLQVQKMPQLLTVRVQKIVVTEEKVQPGVPAAVAGRERVTSLVVYLNGQEVRRTAQNVEIIERPQGHVNL